jgi:predicted choloylglycine hydrolase
VSSDVCLHHRVGKYAKLVARARECSLLEEKGACGVGLCERRRRNRSWEAHLQPRCVLQACDSERPAVTQVHDVPRAPSGRKLKQKVGLDPAAVGVGVGVRVMRV